MDLLQLRCFRAVAEELHFARVAERLHMDQSPLSRVIRDLEAELGVLLFKRTTRSTQITLARAVLLEHVPQIFAAVQRARESVEAIGSGYQGQLRIALSDGVASSRLPRCWRNAVRPSRILEFVCTRCRLRSRWRARDWTSTTSGSRNPRA